MTKDEFLLLKKGKVQDIIEESLGKKVAELALSLQRNEIPVALVSSQVKYLQKSQKKLPRYFKARCILPARAFEQSSSEQAAALKLYQGKRCLDLTCGLGVDTQHFSQHFEEVVSLESNPVLAEITAYNMQRMGISNVKVLPTEAAAYIAAQTDLQYDLIYLDPDRRDQQGQRKLLLEEYSPDLPVLLPKLLQLGKTVLAKLSPLFDITELIRRFPKASKIEVVSIQNECKEVLIEWQRERELETKFQLSVVRKNEVSRFGFVPLDRAVKSEAAAPALAEALFILEPDVAFYKASLTEALFSNYFSALTGSMNHASGYFFSAHAPEKPFPGRVFKVLEAMPYKPKVIAKRLKRRGLKRLHVSRRYFRFKVADIRKQLKVEEGGSQFLLCTQDPKGAHWAFLAELQS